MECCQRKKTHRQNDLGSCHSLGSAQKSRVTAGLPQTEKEKRAVFQRDSAVRVLRCECVCESERYQLMRKGRNMYEQDKHQSVPVKVYRTDMRLMVTAPMAGMEPENIVVEVTEQNQLILHGQLRGLLKEIKELLMDEWSVGSYHRELALPVPVNAVCANVSYGNGVLTLAFPISECPVPAHLTLERVAPSHGRHKGNAGHPPVCSQT